MKSTALALAFVVLASLAPASHADIEADIATLKTASGTEPATPEMQAAWKRLGRSGARTIPPLLKAMNGASPAAENWLRSAVDAIVPRNPALSETELVAVLSYLLQSEELSPRARRVAYEGIARLSPAAAGNLLPTMLNDTSLENRYEAVQSHLSTLKGVGEGEYRRDRLKLLLPAARDPGQLQEIKKSLEDLGEEVNLTEVMGYVTQWKIVGPLDNTGLEGFAKEYRPETNLDFDASLEGKSDQVEWQPAEANDKGTLDFVDKLGATKEAVAYAYATVTSDESGEAELRYSSKNATKVWVNGEQVAANEVYHSGGSVDQYRVKVTLKKGENTLLVKVCQNEQKQPWERDWDVALRIVDEVGTPVVTQNK